MAPTHRKRTSAIPLTPRRRWRKGLRRKTAMLTQKPTFWVLQGSKAAACPRPATGRVGERKTVKTWIGRGSKT